MKKTLIVILVAILLGGGSACYLFTKVVVRDDGKVNETMVNAFQIGAFTNYENAVRVADRNNGVVVLDGDIYRVYVAVLNDQEAIQILKKYYAEIGLTYYLKEISVSKSYIDNIKDVQELLKKSSSDTYVVLNNEMLRIFKEMLTT